jgi:hypothetical protein
MFIDPVEAIVAGNPRLGVGSADSRSASLLQLHPRRPTTPAVPAGPTSVGPPPPVVNPELRALVFAIRDAEGGWKASSAQVVRNSAEGDVVPSIVLITFLKGKLSKRVRLDVGKGMFLDSRPTAVRADDGRELALEVATNWSKAQG